MPSFTVEALPPPAGQMADSTAMTVDFLRARLLSERSVSRAARERADELAKRVRTAPTGPARHVASHARRSLL